MPIQNVFNCSKEVLCYQVVALSHPCIVSERFIQRSEIWISIAKIRQKNWIKSQVNQKKWITGANVAPSIKHLHATQVTIRFSNLTSTWHVNILFTFLLNIFLAKVFATKGYPHFLFYSKCHIMLGVCNRHSRWTW